MNNHDLAALTYIDGKGKTSEMFIPFPAIVHVLIGLYVDKIVIPNGGRLYRPHALIVISYENEYFFKRCMDVEELQKWIRRFEGNVSSLRYTNLDLSKAFQAHFYTDVDYSLITSVRHDVVSNVIGVETTTRGLDMWEPEGMTKEVNASHRRQTIPRTRQAERYTLWILFIYNFIFTILVFPHTPVDKNNIILFTDTVIIGCLIANLLIPTLLVFWRNFTSRYLPLLFTVAALTSSLLGGYVADFSFSIVSIMILNSFNIVLWTMAMISIKLSKVIMYFIQEWEFVR